MLRFQNTYARLPERFYARVQPTPVRDPRIVKVNRALAALLGADVEFLESPAGAQVLAGNVLPDGAEPLAQAYAGHQFGNFVPRLGDGRAILLGEVVGNDRQRRDVQLKGAGRTPFSRRGDGRAALGPVLREYIVSEAMSALGIPATRALAAVTTGEPVVRDGLLPGAILTRIAASHIRIGTFQFFANLGDGEALQLLTTYALERHYPDAAGTGEDALALLDAVIAVQARLIARWLGVGFVHGVMNTDNMSISGETIDFGPCAFLDEYDPQKTFSSIDQGGRYAFANQPRIGLWNVARLAETLLPQIASNGDDAVRLATARLERFEPEFERAYLDVMREKLGFLRAEEHDTQIVEAVLARLAENGADYTVFFRRLTAALDASEEAPVLALFDGSDAPLREWLGSWRRRLAREPENAERRRAVMQRANPALIPRNHRVEEAIQAAVNRGDFEPFETLVEALAAPHAERPEHARLAEPPRPEERVVATFCGT
jgi:serine/tyrosine/threonine adenylyltransferase